VLKSCSACELPFIRSSEHDTSLICIPCTRINQDIELTALDEAHMALAQHLQNTLEQTQTDDSPLKKELEVATKKIKSLERKIKTLTKKTKTTPKSQIPADLLKTLIFLVHPDKHDNSPAATEATQFLLSLRK